MVVLSGENDGDVNDESGDGGRGSYVSACVSGFEG